MSTRNLLMFWTCSVEVMDTSPDSIIPTTKKTIILIFTNKQLMHYQGTPQIHQLTYLSDFASDQFLVESSVSSFPARGQRTVEIMPLIDHRGSTFRGTMTSEVHLTSTFPENCHCYKKYNYILSIIPCSVF